MRQQIRVTCEAMWITGLLAAVLCGWVLAVAAVTSPPDAWITTKVKLALLTTEGVHAQAVNVDTVDGQVTLHGKVRSADEQQKAEMVAKKIDGVKGVRNLLQVVPAPREPAVQQSDDHLKKQVEDALKAAPSLKQSRISVQSVNSGVVLLAGNAKTLTDHLTAVEVAASVPGVRSVASEIRSPDVVADNAIWRERLTQPSRREYGIPDAARDLWITSATKMRLLADRRTPALDINVDTQEGIVTLFGMVASDEAKAAATADARKVSGVTRVINELQVVPSAQQPAVKAHDEALQREVKKAFENRQDLKDIDVEVKNCVARLTGTVPTGLERLEAAMVARSTQGVCSVQDGLRLSD
jgi:hyperosmotically inducible protein